MFFALGRIDGGIIVVRRLGFSGVMCNLVNSEVEDISKVVRRFESIP